MAEWVQSLGHTCLVTSDHDYWMTPASYEKQIKESEDVSRELGFPIINGLEISLWCEEAVLIGTDACRRWLRERQKQEHKAHLGDHGKNHAYKTMPQLLDGLDYALCLVHPGLRDPVDYSMFHAYEVMNSGSEWDDATISRMRELMPNAKPVRGMDAHSNRGDHHLESCNAIGSPIDNESDIIHWIKIREIS